VLQGGNLPVDEYRQTASMSHGRDASGGEARRPFGNHIGCNLEAPDAGDFSELVPADHVVPSHDTHDEPLVVAREYYRLGNLGEGETARLRRFGRVVRGALLDELELSLVRLQKCREIHLAPAWPSSRARPDADVRLCNMIADIPRAAALLQGNIRGSGREALGRACRRPWHSNQHRGMPAVAM